MRKVVVTAMIVVIAIGLLGCGGSDGESGSRQVSQPKLPEVTVADAEQAMSDAMLVSALSLFLAFGAEEGNTSVGNEEDTLTLSWGEDADLMSGIGLYTITMKEYTVPADDPFGTDYNGYILDGTVVMGSTDGISTTLKMDLTTSHEDAETFPVQSISMDIEGFQNDAEAMPTGLIHINGHEMNFQDLAAAFE